VSIRRLFAIVPIVCALLVQLYAPVGSSYAMAAATDPLATILICQHDQTGSATDQAPALPLSHDECCGLCTLAYGGALPDPAPAPVVVFEPVTRPSTWSSWTSILASADIAEHARARAPPHVS
jgi:hypothetical protein